jgi:hypothetical protein
MLTIRLHLVPGLRIVGAIFQLTHFLGMVLLNIQTILPLAFLTMWVEYKLCNITLCVLLMSHSICWLRLLKCSCKPYASMEQPGLLFRGVGPQRVGHWSRKPTEQAKHFHLLFSRSFDFGTTVSFEIFSVHHLLIVPAPDTVQSSCWQHRNIAHSPAS